MLKLSMKKLVMGVHGVGAEFMEEEKEEREM